jgi:hypothetical protein
LPLVDLPFRVSTGHIPLVDAVSVLQAQIFWTIALVLLGRWLLSRGIRVVVQEVRRVLPTRRLSAMVPDRRATPPPTGSTPSCRALKRVSAREGLVHHHAEAEGVTPAVQRPAVPRSGDL